MHSSLPRFLVFASLLWPLLVAATPARAVLPGQQPEQKTARQAPVDPANIRFINMGGNDCPPCVAWRGLEYPKLQKSEAFSKISYSYVTKSIRSPVPAAFFLPADIKPLKAKLDVASGGLAGSPHQVLIVNGEVHDYWFGAKSAEEIELRIAAVVAGTAYPGKPCARLATHRKCAEN